MRIGDVVTTSAIRHEFANEITSGSVGYKAPKGERFVFVLIGVENKDGPKLDCEDAFNKLGWVRPAETST